MSEGTGLTLDQVRTEDLCEVTITAPDADWLATLVHELIVDQLCAGSHLTSIRSLYPWGGATFTTPRKREWQFAPD